MSFLDRLLGRPQPSAAYSPEDWAALFAQTPTASGINVNATSALRSPTVLAATRAISETVGMMAVAVRKRDGDGWKKTEDHPAAPLVNHFASDWTSATELRTQLQMDAMLHGAGFAQVLRTGGKPKAIHRFKPGTVTVELDEVTGQPWYVVQRVNADPARLSYRDVLHVQTPGSTCDRPMALVTLAKEAIGLDIVMARHQARTFASGGLPRIILSPEGDITPDALKNALKFFGEQAKRNDGEPIILPSAFRQAFKSFGLADMSFLELRRLVIEDIARAMRVPAQLIGDLTKSSYNNVESQSRNFLMYSLLPWLESWESAYTRALIDPKDRKDTEIEFVTRDLLRGDFATQTKAYREAGGGAYLTRNEIRELEGRTPHPDGDGLLNQAGQTDAREPETTTNSGTAA